MDIDKLRRHLHSSPGESLEERNAFFRTMRLLSGSSTDGIPDNLRITVQMLRDAFPEGIQVGSSNYNALCAFLDSEAWPHRAIAHALDFAFDLGYLSVLNNLGTIPDAPIRQVEINRVQELLSPHGLVAWRSESEDSAAS